MAGSDDPDKGKRAATRVARVGKLKVAERRGAITPAQYQLFFEALAQTGNIRRSLASARMDRSSAYGRYRADPAFRRLWDDALDEASEVLAAKLLAAALEDRGSATGWPEGALNTDAFNTDAFDTDRAIKTLKMLDARKAKARAREVVVMMPVAEVRRLLMKRIGAMERRLAKP